MPIKIVMLMTLFVSSMVYAQNLEEVLADYYEAAGGTERLQNISSFQINGTINYKGQDMPFMITVKTNRSRMEYNVNGASIIRVFDGKKGWEINSLVHGDTPHPLTCSDVAFMKELAEVTSPLFAWREKGHTVVFKGKQEQDGKTMNRVDLKSKHGGKIEFYFDQETNLPSMSVRSEGEGHRVVIKVEEYQKVDGLTFVKAMRVGEKRITYQNTKANLAIDDSIFRADGATPLLADR